MNTVAIPAPQAAPNAARPNYIRWFDEVGIKDVPLVGGKNASLGEMYRELSGKGVKVPNGFAVTADAYRYFLCEAGLDGWVYEQLTATILPDNREMLHLAHKTGFTVKHDTEAHEVYAELRIAA
jgi:phosphoenolpyruvate synthase/pyruvate phosphate dikinase